MLQKEYSVKGILFLKNISYPTPEKMYFIPKKVSQIIRLTWIFVTRMIFCYERGETGVIVNPILKYWG